MEYSENMVERIEMNMSYYFDDRIPRDESARLQKSYEKKYNLMLWQLIHLAMVAKIRDRRKACFLMLELGKENENLMSTLRKIADVTRVDPEPLESLLNNLRNLAEKMRLRVNDINECIDKHNKKRN